jgi:GNAT superfamily N-acetyltransferase
VRRLGPGDEAWLQALCEQCADYYELVYGHPAPAGEAATMLTELPPGRSADDKFVFELEGGVIDIVRGYRVAGEWYLGLMLFPPSARSAGRGKRALEALIEWLKTQRARRICLAVAEQNDRALQFWKRHGFKLDRRHPPRVTGARLTVLLELVRDVPAD